MSRSDVVAYTQAEAARELGVTGATVIRWMEMGLLEQTDIVAGTGVYFTGDSVRGLKAQRDADQAADGPKRAA